MSSKELPKGKADLEGVIDKSLNDILMSMFDSEHDLELKTHIYNPKEIADLKMIARTCISGGIKETGEELLAYIKDYLEGMVSYLRKSRDEVIKAFRSLSEKETVRMSFTEKLGTNLK